MVDSNTEILTSCGWKYSCDIDYKDKVAFWSFDGKIIFDFPEKIISDVINPNQYSFVESQGNCIDFCVTKDHVIPKLSGRNREKWKFVNVCDYVNKSFAFPVSGLSDVFDCDVFDRVYTDKQINRKIICNSYNYRKKGLSKEDAYSLAESNVNRICNLKYKPVKLLSLYECKFIGFWLGDGSAYKKYSMTQSLAYPNIIEWIEDVLYHIDIHYTVYVGQGSNKNKYKTWSFSRGTGGDKQFIMNGIYRLEPYLNKEGAYLFWGFSEEQFGALMEGLWFADGEHGVNNVYKLNGKKNRVTGTQKKLYDLLQAIGVCRNYRINMRYKGYPNNGTNCSPQWSIRWQKRKSTFIGWAKPFLTYKKNISSVYSIYKDKKLVITRRNGQIFIL